MTRKSTGKFNYLLALLVFGLTMLLMYLAVLVFMAVDQQVARVLVLVMLAFWLLVLGFQIYFRKIM